MPVNYNFRDLTGISTTRFYSFDNVFVPYDLFSFGDMSSWGYNNYGQLGLNDTNNRYSPTTLYKNYFDVRKVSAGYDFASIILSDGSLFVWGSEEDGKLGNGSDGVSYQSSPISLNLQYKFRDISCGYNHMGSITDGGLLFLWGNGTSGQLGEGSFNSYTTPYQVSSAAWVSISCGKNFTYAINTSQEMRSCGLNDDGQLGIGNTNSTAVFTQVVSPTSYWSQISCGKSHAVGISSDGRLFGTGSNNYGQIGIGNASSVFRSMSSLREWKQISCGDDYTIIIKTDGSMWSWGKNTTGQLGVGAGIGSTDVGIRVGTDIDWKQVSCGTSCASAVKTDGTIWVWGLNDSDQLGIGSNKGSVIYSPTKIDSIKDVKSTSVGNFNFYSIRYQNIYN